jgi:hypothetical protein
LNKKKESSLQLRAAAMSASSVVAIDEALYSRQLYTLGRASMQRLRLANVLLIGIDAV